VERPSARVRTDAAGEDLVRDDRDDADVAPRSIVADPSFDWGDDAPPRVVWERTVIYEAHVRASARDIRRARRRARTYAGLHAPAALEHLVALGVTAVELLPVQHSIAERHLAAHGLTNYWATTRSASSRPTRASRRAADAASRCASSRRWCGRWHRVGIEVILDVVYNHTAEGDRLGPTLSRSAASTTAPTIACDPADPRAYVNLTGCGNTLDLRQPRVLALVVDSVTLLVETMHVDGFRFDLASGIGRATAAASMRTRRFSRHWRADPALGEREADRGTVGRDRDGYALGRYPAPWREWNDRYRDDVRRWWRGEAGPRRRRREQARRLSRAVRRGAAAARRRASTS